jgi:hypothetical protein
MMVRDPVIKQVPGGVRLSHREKFNRVVMNGEDRKIPVTPFVGEFVRNFAMSFSNWRVEKFEVFFVPKAGSNTSGSIIAAPVYNSVNPIKLESNAKAKSIWKLDQMSGATSFAAWMEGAASFVAARAVRTTFKTLGLTGSIQTLVDGVGARDSDESLIPGYILYSPDDKSDVAASDIWIDYTFVFIDPVAQQLGVSYHSASTDSSALALETAKATGWTHGYVLNGNSVQFQYPGHYTVTLSYTGSTPNIDTDGHSLVDDLGNDITAEVVVPAFDITSNAFDTVMDADDQATSNGSVQTLALKDIKPGDMLTLDSLVTGTMTGMTLSIIPHGHVLVLRD